MKTIFANLINGNLKDAKKGAKRYSHLKLFNYAFEELGWTTDKANKAAIYLKTGGMYQAFCDAE